MAALRAAGFRDALPGEYTFRAFMNGKLDLTRSESVMELVCAKTDKGRHHAINRLSGVLENEINIIKKKLVEVLSGAEIFLDYSEDEISADPEEIAGRLPGQLLAQEALVRLKKLDESWQHERIYQEGVLVVIGGQPNAGKSSLFNLLLKEERSIVNELPGTTRDWIEASVSVEGVPVRLVDTAGLRESMEAVEKKGVERSRSLLGEADLILYLIDGVSGITGNDNVFINELKMANQYKPLLLLWNKADIVSLPVSAEITAENILGVSAKTGEGITELTSAIVSAIGCNNDIQTASIGTTRQKNLVKAAFTALEEALNLTEQEEPLDLIAPLLRDAVKSVGEITGEVSTSDILEAMFSKFCVGK
jgi:tRNA modification GTPase